MSRPIHHSLFTGGVFGQRSWWHVWNRYYWRVSFDCGNQTSGVARNKAAAIEEIDTVIEVHYLHHCRLQQLYP